MSVKEIEDILLQKGFHPFDIKPKKGGIEITMGFRVSVTASPDLFLVRYSGEMNGSPEHLTQLNIYCDALKASGLKAETKNFAGKCGDQSYNYWAIEVVR